MASSPAARRDLRFGIVSAAPEAASQLGALCRELGRQGLDDIEPRVYAAFPQLYDAVARGDVQIAWLPPIGALELEIAGSVVLTLSVWRGAGEGYFGAIFVAASFPISTLTEVVGKRMAWVDPQSAAGYVFPRLKMLATGLVPDVVLAEQTFYRTHEDVARAVMERRADVGATCVAFYPGTKRIQSAGWSKGNAYRDEAVRILATAGPIPPDTIVVARRVEEPRRRRLADALMRVSVAHGTRALVTGLFSGDGFLDVSPSHYDALRKMVVEGRRTARAAAR